MIARFFILITITVLGLMVLLVGARAITPASSPSAENNRVVKAGPGRLYVVVVANQTATAGFVIVLNAVSAPVDGAVVPLLCAALPASGTATINVLPQSASFSTGITVVLTSATTCFTKTTGVITGFISALAD